jgi:hypothetical protein
MAKPNRVFLTRQAAGCGRNNQCSKNKDPTACRVIKTEVDVFAKDVILVEL